MGLIRFMLHVPGVAYVTNAASNPVSVHRHQHEYGEDQLVTAGTIARSLRNDSMSCSANANALLVCRARSVNHLRSRECGSFQIIPGGRTDDHCRSPKAHRRHSRSLWFPTDIFGLFTNNVVSFSHNVGLRGALFSLNVVRK